MKIDSPVGLRLEPKDGRKNSELDYNRFLDRIEVWDKSQQERSYLKENRFLDRIDIFKSTDGGRTGEVRYNIRYLDQGSGCFLERLGGDIGVKRNPPTPDLDRSEVSIEGVK